MKPKFDIGYFRKTTFAIFPYWRKREKSLRCMFDRVVGFKRPGGRPGDFADR
jgi:hypothetical protein